MNANLYNLLLAIHIIAVALWLGANFSMGVAANRSVGASNEINAWWAGVQGLMGRTMKNAAFALLLLTGIAMVLGSNESMKFSAPFVSIGFLVVIVGGALGGMVFAPGARKAAESFQSGDAAAGKAQVDKMGMIGMAESLAVVVTILFMVFKWGGLGG